MIDPIKAVREWLTDSYAHLTMIIAALFTASPANGLPASNGNTIAPPSVFGPQTSAPASSAIPDPAVSAAQGASSDETRCLNSLSAAFDALGDLQQAKCQVNKKIPGCSDHVACEDQKSEFKPVTNDLTRKKAPPRTGGGSQGGDSGGGSNGGGSGSGGGSSGGGTGATPSSTGGSTATPSSTETSSTDDTDTSDLADCRSLASAAQDACAGGDDSLSSQMASSLSSTCKDMQDAGLSSANNKNAQAKQCQNAWMSCAQKCKSYADTHSESDNWSIYNSTSSTCMSLSSKSQAMLDAATQSNKASSAGSNCLTNASDGSSGKKDDKGNSFTGNDQLNAQNAACTANPAAPGCNTAPQYTAALKGESQFGSAATNTGSIDVAGTAGVSSPGFQGDGGGAGQPGAKNGTVPNNSGGGIPGSGGGRGAGGSPSPGGGFMGAVASAITDIQKGFLGASGGAAAPAPPPEETEKELIPQLDSTPGLPNGGRGLASLGSAAGLKRYLPGGDLWRGSVSPANAPTYHAPGVNIFNRIHERIIEKCKLGVLFDCQ